MQLLVLNLLLLTAEGFQYLNTGLFNNPARPDELADESGFKLEAGGMVRSLAASLLLKFASTKQVSWHIIFYNGKDILSSNHGPRDHKTWASCFEMETDVFRARHTLMMGVRVPFVRIATKVRCLQPSRKKQRSC